MIINDSERKLGFQTRAVWCYLRTLVAFAISVAAFEGRASSQQPESVPSCDKREVSYSALDPTFDRKIKLAETTVSGPPSTSPDTKRSPQGTRYLLLQSPDFSKPGPWTTSVFIGGAGLNGHLMKLTFTDHASGGVHAQWLNEKLLFIDVWWGRIVSTDLILDVDSWTFLYKEDAQYGGLIQPCR